MSARAGRAIIWLMREKNSLPVENFQERINRIISSFFTYFILVGMGVNSVWFFIGSPGITLIQNLFALLLLIGCRILYRFSKEGQGRTVFNFYVYGGIALGGVLIYTASEPYHYVGIFLIALFVMVGFFSIRKEKILTIVLTGGGTMIFSYGFRFVGHEGAGGFLFRLEILLVFFFLTASFLYLGYRIALLVQESFSEINERRREESRLREQQDKIFALIPDPFYLTDRQGRILKANAALQEVLGRSEEEILGSRIDRFLPRENSSLLRKTTLSLLKGESVRGAEIVLPMPDGKNRFFEINVNPLIEGETTVGTLSLARDITRRKNMEERLFSQSITDSLTELNNRSRLDVLLNEELAKSDRYATAFSLILTDIDHFKRVNDNFGHQTGDRVLKEVARILSENIRGTDVVGRWGGEEFMIICPGTDASSAGILAEKLRELIARGIKGEGAVTASFGVTQYRSGDTPLSIMARVDRALYRAKEEGRNRTCRL